MDKKITITFISVIAAVGILIAVMFLIFGGNGNDGRAPDFTVYDEDGNEARLSDYRGKPVVLNFWASWCYYCIEEMPDFNEAYKNHPDVQFLMVNVTDGYYETMDSARRAISEGGYDFDVFFDIMGDAVGAYGVSSYPVTFFIDSDGKVVLYNSGMLTANALEEGISMIKEK